MYQVFFLAFLALSAGVPLGDNWQPSSSGWQDDGIGQRSFQPDLRRDDDSQLVDSLGGGYSFFKKQPIVARPVIQQKLASYDQQVPISSFADTSNQWSDYTRASVFKHQPRTIDLPIHKDLIRDQGPYGSDNSGDKVLVKTIGDSYGQRDLPQPWVVKANGGYGERDLPPPLAPKSTGGYGERDLPPPTWTPKSTGGYGERDLPPPLAPKSNGGYGERDLPPPPPTWTPKSTGGYGEPDVPRTWTPKSNDGYGQRDLPPTWTPKSTGGYSERDLPPTWTPKSTGGYGERDLPPSPSPRSWTPKSNSDSFGGW